MAFEIVTSSPAAVACKPKLKQNEIYPFELLEVGQSFTASLKDTNWKSLRICVYQRNARSKGGKAFAFLKHDDLELCEVARIA